MNSAIKLFIILSPLQSLFAFSTFITPSNILLVFIICLLFIKGLYRGLRFDKTLYTIILFGIILAFTLLLNINSKETTGFIFYTIYVVIIVSILYLSLINTTISYLEISKFLLYAILLSFMIGIIELTTYTLEIGTLDMWHYSNTHMPVTYGIPRMRASFNEPGKYATSVVLITALSLYYISRQPTFKKELYIFILIINLVLTFSTALFSILGLYLGFALILRPLVFVKKSIMIAYKYWFVLVIIFFIYLLFDTEISYIVQRKLTEAFADVTSARFYKHRLFFDNILAQKNDFNAIPHSYSLRSFVHIGLFGLIPAATVLILAIKNILSSHYISSFIYFTFLVNSMVALSLHFSFDLFSLAIVLCAEKNSFLKNAINLKSAPLKYQRLNH